MFKEFERPVNPREADYVPPEPPEDCPSFSPEGGYECTRAAGHGGSHAAHNLYNQLVAIWSP